MSEPIIVPCSVIQDVYGDISQQAVSKSVKSGEAVRVANGYDLVASARNRIARLAKEAEATPGLTEARTRQAEARAQLLEQQQRERSGQLLRYETVWRGFSGIILRVRARMLALPARLAPHVVRCRLPAEAAELMRAEVYAALTEISREDRAKIDPALRDALGEMRPAGIPDAIWGPFVERLVAWTVRDTLDDAEPDDAAETAEAAPATA
jgi:hypothetical protein